MPPRCSPSQPRSRWGPENCFCGLGLVADPPYLAGGRLALGFSAGWPARCQKKKKKGGGGKKGRESGCLAWSWVSSTASFRPSRGMRIPAERKVRKKKKDSGRQPYPSWLAQCGTTSGSSPTKGKKKKGEKGKKPTKNRSSLPTQTTTIPAANRRQGRTRGKGKKKKKKRISSLTLARWEPIRFLFYIGARDPVRNEEKGKERRGKRRRVFFPGDS